MFKSLLTLSALVTIVYAETVDNVEIDGFLSNALQIIKNCGDKTLMLCFKERALHYFDADIGDLSLTEDISLVRMTNSNQGRTIHNNLELPVEFEARENRLDDLLLKRLSHFLDTHSLQFKLNGNSVQNLKRDLDESREKKKKKRKMLMPLLLLFKLKMAALVPLAIGFLALLSFKALVIGKIALLLSTIIGLKKLMEPSKDSHIEVVAHPHHPHEERSYHDSSHIESQQLAYNASLPEN